MVYAGTGDWIQEHRQRAVCSTGSIGLRNCTHYVIWSIGNVVLFYHHPNILVNTQERMYNGKNG